VADDAAKRAFDIVRGLAVWNDYDTRIHSPYLAIRLSDGGSDQTLYDTKRDAVRHQLDETQCAYFSFRESPNGFGSPRDAAVFLAFHRLAYDRGFRLPDPDDRHGGHDLVMPDMNEHLQNQLNRLAN
jgi:hypothetical protein